MKRILALILALFPAACEVEFAAAQNTFFAASPGQMIYRGASGWSPVTAPASSGQFLISQGPTAMPVWTFNLSSLPSTAYTWPTIPTNRVMGNATGSNASFTAITVNQVLDMVGYDTLRPPGPSSMIYKDPTTGTWQALAAGPAGFVLAGGGTTAPPTWIQSASTVTPSALLCPLFSTGLTTAPAYRCITGTDLPNPSTTTFGGIFSLPVTSNSVLSGIGNDGQPTRATTTGTGDVVRATSPTITGGTFVTPSFTGALTVTSNSASALAVGPNGAVNPALKVDASASSSATGIVVTSHSVGVGADISVSSSTTNDVLRINALGTGTINIGNASTGAVTISPATFLNGATTVPSILGPTAITSTSATAFTVGRVLASVTPSFTVDSSQASAVTGVKVTGQAVSAGADISVTSSTINESLRINAIGTGSINIGNTSTGAISLFRSTVMQSGASLTLSSTATLGSPGMTLCGRLLSANMNSTADQSITITVPSTNYMARIVNVVNASTSLTTAAGGIYTGASKTGGIVIPASQSYAVITGTGINTSNNGLTTSSVLWTNATTLFLSLTTPQGGAATADFYVYCQPMP